MFKIKTYTVEKKYLPLNMCLASCLGVSGSVTEKGQIKVMFVRAEIIGTCGQVGYRWSRSGGIILRS
jgi:hypothetical protein